MSKKLLFATLCLSLLGGVRAQSTLTTGDTTLPGYDGSRVVILNSREDGLVSFLSEDKRYLSGSIGVYGGFVYDLQKDTILTFEDQMHAYFSPNHYVAAPAGENMAPFIMINGAKKELEPSAIGPSSSYHNDLSYWSAQPNGKNIVIMGYEYYTDNRNDTLWGHVGLVYNGEDGTLRARLRSPWEPSKPFRGNENNLGYGSRGFSISADGTVVGGHAAWPDPLAFSNTNPSFWDLSALANGGNVKAFGIEDHDFTQSDLHGVNRDGSILVGYNEGTAHGLIIYYDRAKGTFSLDTIAPLPGWDLLIFNNISDDGLITGYCGLAGLPTSRMAVVYKDGELMPLQTYLYEYYNIAVPEALAEDLATPTIMSADGRTIAGFFNDRGAWISWFIELSDKQMLPRARDIMARASQKTLSVRLDWQKPLRSDRTLTGYEIYRDEETTPLATVDADITFYNDPTVKEGSHTYHIIAVYGTEKSIKATSNTVLAVEGGNFPVQQVQHHLQYGRYATIYWGLPSSEVGGAMTTYKADIATPLAPGEKTEAAVAARASRESRPARMDAKYANPAFDYIFSVNTKMFDGYAGMQIDDLFYATSWKQTGIRVINQFGAVVQELKPDGLNSAIRSMVRIQNEQEDLLFCGSVDEVNVINLKDTRRVLAFTEGVKANIMAYMPDMTIDGHTGVFLLGDSTAKYYYRNDVNKLIYIKDAEYDFSGMIPSGAAYYDGKLYVASNSGPYLNELYTFDAKTCQQIGDPVQLMEDPAVQLVVNPYFNVNDETDYEVAFAGGLGICMLEDSTMALVAGSQCSYTHSRLLFLELESAPMRESYTLYRNGKVIADNLKTRRYSDELEAGSYGYHVVVNVKGGKHSAPSPVDSIIIPDYENCFAPISPKAREINRWVDLSWDVPEGASGIVGFNIYRNDELLDKLWNMQVAARYTDFSDLALNTPYQYRIEMLYENGCLADTVCTITLTDDGMAMAPFGLHVDYTKAEGGFKPTVTWETPLFEETLSIGYGSGEFKQPASFDGITEYWAAIGYDASNLALYKDLYLVGMEYFLGNETKLFEALVYLNDTLVYTETLPRTQAGEWQTLYFQKSFSMNQPDEVAFGYHTRYSSDASPLVLDYSYNLPLFSDLISFDGAEWYSLTGSNVSASHCIRGLVARKYDLEAATTDGVVNYDQLAEKVMRVSMEAMPMNLQVKPMNVNWKQAAPKATLTLRGFNLYREDYETGKEEQLNDDLMTTFVYEDKVLPAGDYTYTVEADFGSEKKSASVDVTLEDVSTEDAEQHLDLTLYPNPAVDVVYVNGAYRELQILDLGGRVLRQQAAASQIELGDLTPGTYFFRFTAEDGRGATYKVVVR